VVIYTTVCHLPNNDVFSNLITAGGEAIDIYQNNKKVCEAKPTYGAGAGGMSHGAGEHIKSMTACHLMTSMKPGDTFYLVAKYDLTKHTGGRTDNGELDEVSSTTTRCYGWQC
jgi:hypothetical protein